MTTATLDRPSLQQRFMAFAVSPTGMSLTDLESKCLLSFYAAANPTTGIVTLSCGRIAKNLKLKRGTERQDVARAADSLTDKGILETLIPSKLKAGEPEGSIHKTVAVRKIVL